MRNRAGASCSVGALQPQNVTGLVREKTMTDHPGAKLAPGPAIYSLTYFRKIVTGLSSGVTTTDPPRANYQRALPASCKLFLLRLKWPGKML